MYEYGDALPKNVVRFERSANNLTVCDVYDTYEDILVKYGLLLVKDIVPKMMTPQLWKDYQRPAQEIFNLKNWSYVYSHKIQCNMNVRVHQSMALKSFDQFQERERQKLTQTPAHKLYWDTVDLSFYGSEDMDPSAEVINSTYSSYYAIKSFTSNETRFTETGFKGNWCQHMQSFGKPKNVLTRDILHNEEAPILEGIGSPASYFYQGTEYSSFPHHFEDFWLPSVNYHYHGAEKYWIGVPASDTQLVWNIIKYVADTYKKKPLEKQYIITPRMLYEFGGIPSYEIHQQPGDMVISASGASHGGFNLGYNQAEAINFADCSSDAFDGWAENADAMADFFQNERGKQVPYALMQAAGLVYD